ncbi:MAG TPA: ferredoxin [Saprospiraceae bacterium]|nr:ferredoxin [Saprospiraceae bacterium]MCB9269526.1 ferredoxin [Lewinellaceae bacterium]HPG06160.1 ferredoxin [Saprospiraceae bacterium]HPQ98027.1 ferredoxin [Saprospiraceae bacterium]HQU54086.1 ferredoxin [Saprospiraceae bacterium]
MIVVTQNRKKCIGCNYCVELAHNYWRMSRKDGKSVLLNAVEKRDMYSVRLDDDAFEANEAAAKACPVRIIQVKKIN